MPAVLPTDMIYADQSQPFEYSTTVCFFSAPPASISTPHDHRSRTFSLAWVLQWDGFGSRDEKVIKLKVYLFIFLILARCRSLSSCFPPPLEGLVWPLGNNLDSTKEGNPQKRQFLLCGPLTNERVNVCVD